MLLAEIGTYQKKKCLFQNTWQQSCHDLFGVYFIGESAQCLAGQILFDNMSK